MDFTRRFERDSYEGKRGRFLGVEGGEGTSTSAYDFGSEVEDIKNYY